MRTPRRLLLTLIPAVLLLALVVWFEVFSSRHPLPATVLAPAADQRPVVAAIRAEPRSFNRLVALDRGSLLLSLLLHARLVQLNHKTQEIEPALATSWTLAPDGRTYTLTLRPDVVFSDGAPFTADDVLFTFEAVYDPKVDSPLASALMVGGKPIAVSKTGSHSVVLTFPAPYGPGLRLLDALPILPAHKLRDALAKGELAKAWTAATPPDQLAGLGPFVLRSYTAGERLELARNPRYGARGPGVHPGVERLTLRIVPTQGAERLALEAGELDLLNSELRPDDVKAVRAMAAAGKAKTYDLGPAVDADSLWFNLRGDAKKPAAARPWTDVRFRRAMAHAVDRQAFIDTVYLGAGTPVDGPITPGNRAWHASGLPQYPFDVAKAKALLAEAGLTDTDGDGLLDVKGAPLTIQLLTQRGHVSRERGSAVIAADLQKVGLTVDVVALDPPALAERITSGNYDAVYYGVSSGDTDPSANLDYWLSSGSFHFWNPGQAKPATPWEAEIDQLMQELTALTDIKARQERFTRVQQIFATELPAIFIAAPTFTTATSVRVEGLEPASIYPYLLWRADTMRLAPPR
jgi:peptide/nickel transport system substrate-binding protein